jgi:poly-gamma-glutamate synthesis protein (capsule biosynthesis protein)
LLPWRIQNRLDDAHRWSARFAAPLEELTVGPAAPGASLIATGDIAITDGLEEYVFEGRPKELLGDLPRVFSDCDLRVGNLESMFVAAGKPNGILGSFMRSSPKSVDVLKEAGFDAVTVANNHCMDFGAAGHQASLEVLRRSGIQSCGGGEQPEIARRPAILTAKGLRVAMFGYCDDFRADLNGDTSSGPAPSFDDIILADVQKVREHVDLVVVQLHWGYEFVLHPFLSHRERARKLAGFGVDLVLCHHAHVPMGVERWGKSVIAYGLGNFLFHIDPYLRGGHPWTDRSYVLKVFFSRAGIDRAELVPVGMDANGVVRRLAGCSRRLIAGALRKLSERLNDSVWLEHIESARLAREAVRVAHALSCAKEPEHPQEWAQWLGMPRQRDLIEWLIRQESTAGIALGHSLRSFYQASLELSPVPARVWDRSRAECHFRVTRYASTLGQNRLVGVTP